MRHFENLVNQNKPAFNRLMHNHPTTKMINKYLVRAAASEAMDGAAPDLERDAPWREKQHARGTACTNLVIHNIGLLSSGLKN